MKKDKQVLEMLKQDMDKRTIPDFWDKIQEQRQISPPHPKLAFHQTSQSTNNTLKLLSIVAAAFFIFNVIPLTILNIVSLTVYHKPVSFGCPPEAPPNDDTFDYSAIVSIDIKQLHGTFLPSTKTFDELSMIFSSLKNTDVVYEDNDYIYKFDKAGTLSEMLCTHDITPSHKISQEDIEKITDDILAIYFPKFEVYTNDKIIYEYKDDIWNINISHFYYDGKTTTTTYYYSNIHIQLSPDGQILKIELSSSNESS